ncbi:hypothetical protein KCP74_03210 [Salmonella enterica subsp. enterica]|nr:hypothetical protein KCP74_03210 [Salmonella enterica subsp. enterica]
MCEDAEIAARVLGRLKSDGAPGTPVRRVSALGVATFSLGDGALKRAGWRSRRDA